MDFLNVSPDASKPSPPPAAVSALTTFVRDNLGPSVSVYVTTLISGGLTREEALQLATHYQAQLMQTAGALLSQILPALLPKIPADAIQAFTKGLTKGR